ncbi:HAD-IA family hydrolase [Sedimenticola sp.]|uniref:HAD-IA family hydrolase n=1 Tax=Sedimenticola sp. TaxID=1940285 RepID=UPI0025882183|nr:HAD-IA family hydrolase [Sedimenticola sp.]MCW8902519.1 HAD-IA family hydrolase [Sedimenticola sp.]
MKRNFKLLVFDWDGTLMDSEARIVSCVRAATRDMAIETPADERIRDIIGLGLKEALEKLFPGSDEPFKERFIAFYRRYFLHEDSTPSLLFPGALEVLNGLVAQDYLLAVATGKGRPGLDKVLDETGLKSLFHATRCADETFSKPHPEMLMQIMDELAVEPADTLMIGDTEYDLQMAINAGTHGLAVSYGVHSVDRLNQFNPLGCLDDISELSDWLDR